MSQTAQPSLSEELPAEEWGAGETNHFCALFVQSFSLTLGAPWYPQLQKNWTFFTFFFLLSVGVLTFITRKIHSSFFHVRKKNEEDSSSIQGHSLE